MRQGVRGLGLAVGTGVTDCPTHVARMEAAPMPANPWTNARRLSCEFAAAPRAAIRSPVAMGALPLWSECEVGISPPADRSSPLEHPEHTQAS